MFDAGKVFAVVLGCIIYLLLYVLFQAVTRLTPYEVWHHENYAVVEQQGFYEAALEEDVQFSTLLMDYHEQLKVLKDEGYWRKSPVRKSCDNELNQAVPCRETQCDISLSRDPSEVLRSILRSMKDLDKDKMNEITRLLRSKYTHRKVLFVTAASSNHFQESQALIHNLHDNVFPYLTNYSFVYYDLGLTTEERNKANLPTADMLVWMDASVRFGKRTVLELLETVEKKRLAINWGYFSVADHTQVPMFDYFEEKTCSFAHLSEMEVNLVSFKNNRFIREVVTKPWAACALSSNCMCLKDHSKYLWCNTGIRKRNKCHRFDQSAMSIILSKLFRGYELSVRIPPDTAEIRREQRDIYYEKKIENNVSV